MGNMRVATVPRSLGAMKALQATCIVGAITFTWMIHQVGGNTPGATVADAMPEDCLPKARPIAFSDSPRFQRSHNSVFSAAVNPL